MFAIHQPGALAEWLAADTLDGWVKAMHLEGAGVYPSADAGKPSTLRGRIGTMPNLEGGTLYPNQIEAITALEKSLREDRPRALVQMATGSGKTIMAVTSLYRLVKFGGARRVLFLVDRTNLGEQAEKEFQGFKTPDDHRKFQELYKVQLLKGPTISASTKVVITTVQRLYAMLRGLPEPTEDEESAFAQDSDEPKAPLDVVYNAAIPPEFFDVIVVDECHRSIYTLWRQVLEYFDAYLVGLTATPAKHTLTFFQQNLVMEYSHERAVADRVNVDFEVYAIRTKITEQGSTIEKASSVDVRDRGSQKARWLTDDVTYTGKELDRSVVAMDQIRLIAKTLRDIDPSELQSVTPSAKAKTHFVVADCVGVTEGDLADTSPRERKKTTSFKALLEHVASGGTDPAVLTSLASRLARLDHQLTPTERAQVETAAGMALTTLTDRLIKAADPDAHEAHARATLQLPPDIEPTLEQLADAAHAMQQEAAKPLAAQPELRTLLLNLKASHEQIIDQLSQDELLVDKTGFSQAAKDKAMQTAAAFETWLKDQKDELDALQFFYSVPHRDRLRFADLKALATAIQAPPRSWTPDKLWQAYETLDKAKVKGASGQRVMTDLVSLIRFALHIDHELVPFADHVRARYEHWLAEQANRGKGFTPAQMQWLEMMRDHIAGSAKLVLDDFDATPFAQAGGLWQARTLFGAELAVVMGELNRELAA